MQQQEQILFAILDAGELLLTAGAEVARVEDTIRRMAHAYGFVRTDVLTITASMVVTAQTAEGDVFTQTRRILRRETDMRRIEAVNALSRTVCQNGLPLDALRTRIEQIRSMPDGAKWRLPVAYLLIAGSFAVFLAALGGMALPRCCAVWYCMWWDVSGRASACSRSY